ncbi:hypothetical protein CIB95_12155 [Lottiidibacillus patelloidae]|uniref:SGNH hydrolase-type esterase domain-containing protein n=1 Tax=Lottiidibacillus patelloidae TaxID=2670334 RepID=A0A263BSH3_9BACI|nr:cell wall-binding repeat-containing protein [Lottiidibacillus patelloidae]OZM56518.1 hypothetical protein CIB95_12155 [Lottiidibacillus patelloidae]
MKNTKFIKFIFSFLLVVTLLLPTTSYAYPPQVNQLSYVALGDSLAAGYTPYQSIDKGYPDYVKEALYNLGYEVTLNKDFAVGGYTTANVLADMQVPDVQPAISQADIITISAGGNDLLSQLEITQTGVTLDPTKVPSILNNIATNLTGIVTSIKTLNPDAQIYLMGYFNAMPYLPVEQQQQLLPILEQINGIIEAVALQSGSTFVPTFDVIAENTLEYLPNPQDVHLSLTGYQAIAGEFIQAMVANLPALEKISNRVFGSDRYETSAAISSSGWPTADTVIIASGEDFADGLSGAPLSYKLDAPLLLTQSHTLPTVIKNEIIRLGASNAIILGGNVAVSDDVFNQLEDLELNVRRIAGANRYETAANIALEIGSNADSAILINGEAFADGTAVASFAAQLGYPILFTKKDILPVETSNIIDGLTNIIAVGGTDVISDELLGQLPNKTRIDGKNRFDTAIEVIKHFGYEKHTAYVANGFGFADALTGSVLAAKHDSPIILVSSSSIPEEVSNYLSQKIITEYIFFGGSSAIEDSLLIDILQ